MGQLDSQGKRLLIVRYWIKPEIEVGWVGLVPKYSANNIPIFPLEMMEHENVEKALFTFPPL